MPRNITITFDDGTTHVYQNAPDSVTPQSVYDRAAKEFSGKKIKNIDGGRKAAPKAPEESFGEQAAAFGASVADIGAESITGLGGMVAYPVRRVMGETPEQAQAWVQNALAPVSAPVGRLTGYAESPTYQDNPVRNALSYVGSVVDSVAGGVADKTGLPKNDVLNAMQWAMTLGPVKGPIKSVPGAKVPGKIVRKAVEKVQDVIDPKTKFYMDIAEGRGAELVQAARRPEATILPGAKPTFAQATADVGLPRVAAVGEQAAKLRPTEAQALRDTQKVAREGQIEAIKGTPAEYRAAVKERARKADPLYLRAEKAGDVVDVTPTLAYIEKLINENPGNPELLTEMRRIGKGLTDEFGNARVNAKEISSALDGIKTALSKEDNKNIKGELNTVKSQLTAAIPAMKEAQTAYRKGSGPINEKDVGGYLLDKLKTPLGEGGNRAAVFAQAVRDAPGTIKRALDGQPRYEKLTEVLSPESQARVDAVIKDLSREARVKELAQLGREAAPTLKEPAGKFSLPPLLDRVATIANEIMRRLEGKINEKMATEIALEFLDADRAAAALETAMARSAKRGREGAPPKPAKPPKSMATRVLQRAPVSTAPTNAFLTDARGQSYDVQGNRMAR